VKKKKPYTLGVFTGSSGAVQQATLNNNRTKEAKMIKPDALPSFVLERLSLLRVADNPLDPVITDVGRRIVRQVLTPFIWN